MTPFAEARRYVLDGCAPLEPTERPLDDALGCVLATHAVASEPVPPFANSGMDGYAVRAADVAAADDDHPVRLRVVGTIAAGAPPDVTVDPG
ncbi:MAG TPA: hypothetical protein VHK88_17170, partial [Aquihabitans sp.]|nr:hypothetical protein [Aquihabitans sp.]